MEGIPDLRRSDFTGLVLHSQLPRAGTLTTGSELVNRLISNVEWGLRGNFLDVPTDCPQRDERMGWTGDAQVFAPTACYLRECGPFYAKYLHDLAQEQKDRGGEMPDMIPSFGYAGCSAAGMWRTVWKVLDSGEVRCTCTVPFGCTAQLELPSGRRELELGEYSFHW